MDAVEVRPYGPNTCDLHEAKSLVMNNLCEGANLSLICCCILTDAVIVILVISTDRQANIKRGTPGISVCERDQTLVNRCLKSKPERSS